MSEAPLIPIMRPWMDEEEARAAARPILSGWITQGPEVAAFEKEFAAAVGAANACAVSNCTAALHLALLACGAGPGTEVVTVSHSFVATANAIRYCGALPVFVDIDPATFNMDPELLERAMGPRTRAVLVVHQIGMPADMARILSIARSRGVPVVEDAACAVGSELEWEGRFERVGRPHADVACFSFHPRKVLSTGDGGMITTARADWDARFRRLRHHGMDLSDAARHGAREVVFESFVEPAYNYRLTDVQAAVGRVQLGRLSDIVARRRALAEGYRQRLAHLPIGVPGEPAFARSNWQSYCVRLPGERAQRAVMQSMLEEGIATRRGVMCAHREPAFPRGSWRCGADTDCPGGGDCPHLRHGERAQDHTILLPLYHQMTEADQERVVAALRHAVTA